MSESARNRWLAVCVFLLLAVSSLSAQKMGSIEGVVTDSTEAPIGEAVVVANSTGSDKQSATTDSSGHYSLYPLPPGIYTVSFGARGFKGLDMERAEVRSDRTLTVNVRMQIGAASETIAIPMSGKESHYRRITYWNGKGAAPPPPPAKDKSTEAEKSAEEAAYTKAMAPSDLGERNAALEKFIAEYPNSAMVAKAREALAYGNAIVIRDAAQRAAAFDKFILDYPNSWLVHSAREDAKEAREQATATAVALPENRPSATQQSPPPDRGFVSATPASPALLPRGASFALIIGINRYPSFPQLHTAVQDAAAIEALLRRDYGFQTQLLLDSKAGRSDIMTALSRYKRTLSADDNLLIYYAGHGIHDRESDRVSWLPVNAEPDNYDNWLLTEDITSLIRGLQARHVLVIADSCYSGGMTRDIGPIFNPVTHSAFLEKMAANRSRDLLSSGGDEPVADAGGSGGHSIFASALINGLQNMNVDVFTAGELYANYIRVQVAGHSKQAPEYNFIRDSGHDAGDFIFTRRQR